MANIQHEDAIMKMGMEYFRDTLLKILKINYEYIDPGPTELVSLTVEKNIRILLFLQPRVFTYILSFRQPVAVLLTYAGFMPMKQP